MLQKKNEVILCKRKNRAKAGLTMRLGIRRGDILWCGTNLERHSFKNATIVENSEGYSMKKNKKLLYYIEKAHNWYDPRLKKKAGYAIITLRYCVYLCRESGWTHPDRKSVV